MRSQKTGLLVILSTLFALHGAMAATYYASPKGSDANRGDSPTAAWRSLKPLETVPLQPGDRVLLQTNGTYQGPFRLHGSGTAQKPILLSSYGTGTRPIISGVDTVNDSAVTIENASWWTVRGLSLRHAKIGVYLRYINSYGHTGMVVEQCDFADMPDRSCDPLKHNYELAWTCGVFIGGSANHTDTVLDGVRISNCRFTRIYGVGVYSAWYWPKPNPQRVRHLKYENSVADGCFGGAFGTIDMAESEIYRVHSYGSGGTIQWGTAACMIQSSVDMVFRECLFTGTRRNGCPDGGGFDIEGSCERITFDRCLFYSNDGTGLMHLATGGLVHDVTVKDSCFFNNAISPTNEHDASEVICTEPRNDALYLNCGFYPRPERTAFSDMSELQKADPAKNRFGKWDDVNQRARWWNNIKLTSATWSQPSWFVATEPSYLWVRYRQKKAVTGRFTFLTEADRSWADKRGLVLPTAANGFIEKFFRIDTLTPLAVITQVRVQFPAESGTELQFVRLTNSTDRMQDAPMMAAPLPTSLTIPGMPSSGDAANNGIRPETAPIGDTAQNNQTTMMLSFDTSVLPKDVRLVGVTLKLTRVSVSGPIDKPWEGPWSWREVWGNRMVVDIKRGAMSDPSAWKTTGDITPDEMLQAAAFSFTYADGLQGWAALEARALRLINRTGQTQLRVRFQMPTNGNSHSEYAAFATPEHPKPAWRPVLELFYQPNKP